MIDPTRLTLTEAAFLSDAITYYVGALSRNDAPPWIPLTPNAIKWRAHVAGEIMAVLSDK